MANARWFAGEISREEAERQLHSAPDKKPGDFLLRVSTKGGFALSVVNNKLTTNHFALKGGRIEDPVEFEGQKFCSLAEFVDKFSNGDVAGQIYNKLGLAGQPRVSPALVAHQEKPKELFSSSSIRRKSMFLPSPAPAPAPEVEPTTMEPNPSRIRASASFSLPSQHGKHQQQNIGTDTDNVDAPACVGGPASDADAVIASLNLDDDPVGAGSSFTEAPLEPPAGSTAITGRRTSSAPSGSYNYKTDAEQLVDAKKKIRNGLHKVTGGIFKKSPERKLKRAASSGNVERMEDLLKKYNVDVDGARPSGSRRTPLSVAALNGQLEACERLVQEGANVNAQDKHGNSCLINAVIGEGKETVVKLLLNSGAKVELPNNAKQTALHCAVGNLRPACARVLIDAGAPLDIIDEKNNTPLALAVQLLSFPLLEMLLDAGANATMQYGGGEFLTAIHQVVKMHNRQEQEAEIVVQMLERLIKAAQSLDEVDAQGKTALFLAIEEQSESFTEKLLKAGASPSLPAGNGQTPLLEAHKRGSEEIKKLLLQHGASLDTVGPDGNTVLVQALLNNDRKSALMYLANKADPNIHGGKGEIPILLALSNGCEDVVVHMVENKASPFERDQAGRTPLHLAAVADQSCSLAAMVKAGFSADVENAQGVTPLQDAIQCQASDTTLLQLVTASSSETLQKGADTGSAFYLAVKTAREKVVLALLDRSVDVTACPAGQESPLMIAITNLRPDTVEAIIAQCSKPGLNYTNSMGDSALHVAVRTNCARIVTSLVERDVDFSLQTCQGDTPLLEACKRSQTEIIGLLVSTGRALDLPDNASVSPVMACAENDNVAGLKLLADQGSSLDNQDAQGNTALVRALLSSNLKAARTLIELKAALSIPSGDGRTPLFLAIEAHQESLVDAMVARGVDVDQAGGTDNTPIQLAIVTGQPAIAMRLLPYALTSVDAANQIGETPLHLACERGYETLVLELLRKSADLTAQTRETQRTPLMNAIIANFTKIAGLLIDESSPDALRLQDSDSRTALHFCAIRNNATVAALLVSQTELLSVHDSDDQTALFVACQQGHHAVTKVLLEAKANVNDACSGVYPLHATTANTEDTSMRLVLQAGAWIDVRDPTGDTPLSLMCKRKSGNATRAELLLSHGADPNAQNNNGETPLFLATAAGDLPVMRVLVRFGADMEISDCERTKPLLASLVLQDDGPFAFLVESGCDVNAEDKDCTPALVLLFQRREWQRAKVLIKHGASCLHSFNGHSLLFNAVRCREITLVECMISIGVEVDDETEQEMLCDASKIQEMDEEGNVEESVCADGPLSNLLEKSMSQRVQFVDEGHHVRRIKEDRFHRARQLVEEKAHSRHRKKEELQLRQLQTDLLGRQQAAERQGQLREGHKVKRTSSKSGRTDKLYDIFISYRQESEGPREHDTSVISQLFHFLKNLKHPVLDRNITVWCDKCIPGTKDFREEYRAALNASSVFVALISKCSMDKIAQNTTSTMDSVLDEFEIAVELKEKGEIEICPVRVMQKSLMRDVATGAEKEIFEEFDPFTTKFPATPSKQQATKSGDSQTVEGTMKKIFGINSIIHLHPQKVSEAAEKIAAEIAFLHK
eukprot:m.139699 g.139699  ORF g.139699 m.139699 type:complete len:1603 (-) comp20318_c0_seq7:84-4892(-)